MNAVMERVKQVFGVGTADTIERSLGPDVAEVTFRNGLIEARAGAGSIRIPFPTENRRPVSIEDELRWDMFPFSSDIANSWLRATAPTREIPEKPSTTMLRMMEAPQAGSDTRTALAMAVEDKLGYTPLRKHAGAPSRLQRLLQELEIEAFDATSVAEYKAKMFAHHQALADQRDAETNLANIEQVGQAAYWARVVTSRVRWSMVKLSEYTKPVPEFVLNKALQIKNAAPDARFWVSELREEQRTLDPFLYVTLGKGNPDDLDEAECAAIEVWDEPEFEKTL